MTEQDFDIWLHGFAPDKTREAPQHALCRVFGIPQPAAEALLASLPRVVKRDATLAQAERIVQALESIGGNAEAVPTKIAVAPVVLVGQPASAPSATLVRHARPSAQREVITVGSTRGSADTVRLGTQELAAYFAAEPRVAAAAAMTYAAGAPHDTLVEPAPRWALDEQEQVASAPERHAPPLWADLELSAPDEPAKPVALAATAVMVEAAAAAPPSPELSPATAPTVAASSASTSGLIITRNAHEWIESVAHLPPLSLEPPAAKLLSSAPPKAPAGAWQNPMELPAFDAPPPHGLTMRTAAERARARSIRPASAAVQRHRGSDRPMLSDGLTQLARGELRAVAGSHPSLAFLAILLGVTLAFMVAYAAL